MGGEALLSATYTRLETNKTKKNRVRLLFRPDGYAMLRSPNKGETAVHGCHCPGDMAVRMREVVSI